MRCSKRIFPPRDQSGAIRHGLAGIVLRLAHVADERGEGDGFARAAQLRPIARDEGGALDQVLRRIAAEAKLGKDGEVGAARLRLARHFEDARRIAFEIADGGIELGQGDFHESQVA